MQLISSSNATIKILDAIRSGSATFLTGAGISMISPSALPSGRELKDMIVDGLLRFPELSDYGARLKKNSKYAEVIPEVLFQEVFSVVGDRLFPIYDILKLTNPNLLHFVIAEVANSYKAKIFTTNFDTLIEQFLKNSNDINHLHGGLDDPRQMVILITQVGRGLTKANKLDFLNHLKGRSLVVLGYSGSDKDIMDVINESEVKEVIWLMRDSSDTFLLNNIAQLKQIICLGFQYKLEPFANDLLTILTAPPFIADSKDYTPERNHVKSSFASNISKFESYLGLQLVFFRLGEYQTAAELARLAIKRNIACTPDESLKIVVNLIDNLRLIGKNINVASRLTNQALNSKHAKNGIFIYGQLNNSKGLLLLEATKSLPKKSQPYFVEAIAAFSKALKTESNIIAKDRIITALGKANNNLGLAYRTSGDFVAAAASYRESIRFKKRQGNLLGLAVTQVNLSLNYLKTGATRKSYYWEQQALKIIDKYQDYYRKAFLYREKGVIIAVSNKKKAKLLFELALNIYKTHIPDAVLDIELIKRNIDALK